MKTLLRRVAVVAGLLTSVASSVSFAGEILDNEKVTKMVKEGIALEIVLNQIQASGADCRFDSSSEAMISIKKAAVDGKWIEKDVITLQKKIQEIAIQDRKRLENMAVKASNVWDNADELEYAAMMRDLVREGKPVVVYLLKNLEQESDRKRAGMLDALGRIGDKSPPVVSAAMLMLTDRAKPVRVAAAKCIANLSGPTTCEELITRMNSRTEQHLDGAAMALGYLGDPQAIMPLTKVLKTSVDSDARVCAAFSLGELRAKTTEAVEALLEAVLDDRDEKLREAAARALALTKEARAVPYILKAFHRYPQGKEGLVAQLRYFKDIRAAEFLVDEADSDNPKIKAAVRDTLQAMTGNSFDTGEEWRGWLEANRARPDWVKPTNSAQRLPDLQSSK